MRNCFLVCIVLCFAKSIFAIENADLLFCIDSTLESNSEIKKARADFEAFKETKEQSFASLLPSIGLSISRSKVEQERSDGVGLKLDQNYITESDAISLRQPIYRPKLLKDHEKLKQQVLAEELLLLNKEDVLKMKVIQTYLRLLKSYEERMLTEKRIALLGEEKKAATKSIDAGRGTITELAEIDAAKDKAVADRIRAKQSIKLELNELNFLTGEKIISIKKLDRNQNNFTQFGSLSLNAWEDRAVKGNYEILSKRESISAAKKALQAAKYDRYPTVDLNIALSRGSSESTFFVNSQTKSQSIGLTFFLPIYQGGSINSRIRQSAFLLDSEIEGLRFQEEDLRKRVQKTYFGLKDSIELSGALKSAVKSAMVELEANRKSATAGIRKQLDILISQQNLLKVERELVDNNLNIILFWLNLNMLSGSVDRLTIKKTSKFFK